VTDRVDAAGVRVRGIRWSTAAGMAGVGIVPMVVLGAAVVPAVRFVLQALYGTMGAVVLAPFGLALPGAVGFVLTNVATSGMALSVGRRVGGLLAHQAVSGRLGSHRLTLAAAWIAGAAGAAAFAAAVPWTALPDPSASWPYRVGYVLFGYVLHVAVLAVGPPRGVYRYLAAHPYCRSCWVWMQRETGGGAFAERDARRLFAALAADRFGALRDLPVAQRGRPGRSYTLEWWACPSCHGEAYLSCLPEEGGEAGAAAVSRRVVGPPVRELRSLVAHRHRLQDLQPSRRP
jgi:hypothetical protein